MSFEDIVLGRTRNMDGLRMFDTKEVLRKTGYGRLTLCLNEKTTWNGGDRERAR